MNKTFLVANWKMNFKLPEALVYATALESNYVSDNRIELILAPSTLFVHPIGAALTKGTVQLAAQTLSAPEFGAFTGDTSAAQFEGAVRYAILGHSERRQYFHETDEDIAEKIKFALDYNITPIICVGETAEERNAGQTREVLTRQISAALNSIDPTQVLLAYEPIWAISSTPGAQQATPETITETISIIKEVLSTIAETHPPILYGGSVNPDNAEPYLSLPEISGALIGNASLDIEKIYAIIEIAKRVAK